MKIKFNPKITHFDDLTLGEVFILANDLKPELVFLRTLDFTTDVGDTYNALNLANMEFVAIDEYAEVIPYEATLALE